MTRNNRAPTSDQLRDRIDRGETGDKVDYPDPAAAPLGTDAEAGGYPPTAAERETAYRDETLPHAEGPTRQSDKPADVPIIPIVIVLIGLGVAAVFFMMS